MRASVFFRMYTLEIHTHLSCTLYTGLYTQYRHVYFILFCILCTALNALYSHVYFIPSCLLYTTLYFRLLCIFHTTYIIIWYCLNNTVPILVSCTFHTALNVRLILICAFRSVVYNSGLSEHFILWRCPAYTLHTVLSILLLSRDWAQSTD